MKRIIVTRFSALGDVAMCVPVIKEVLKQNPDIEITFVSKKFAAPLFEGLDRLNFVPIENKHEGFFGLRKLAISLIKGAEKPIALIDLHNVLRTNILKIFFRLHKIPVFSLNKNRGSKNKLVRKNKKCLMPIVPTIENYSMCFQQAGLILDLKKYPERIKLPLDLEKDTKWLGIAPFAKHEQKQLPFSKIEQIIDYYKDKNVKIFLFGAGDKEFQMLSELEKTSLNCISVIKKFDFPYQLKLISNLDVMLSMDSANMHLASIYGTPVVSVWGATHHLAGFLGFRQKTSDIIDLKLNCRPCSVFGDKKCYKGTWECLKGIKAEDIIFKLNYYLD